MSYLVDTDVVANALKGRPEEAALLTNLSPQRLAISLITYGEIYDGIYYGRDPLCGEAQQALYAGFGAGASHRQDGRCAQATVGASPSTGLASVTALPGAQRAPRI